MSTLEWFHAGDAALIAAAWEQSEPLDEAAFVRASANFSLHLAPDWFDDLLEAVFDVAKDRRMSRGEVLPVLLKESEDGSADLVSPAFVQRVAALSETQLQSVAKAWLAKRTHW